MKKKFLLLGLAAATLAVPIVSPAQMATVDVFQRALQQQIKDINQMMANSTQSFANDFKNVKALTEQIRQAKNTYFAQLDQVLGSVAKNIDDQIGNITGVRAAKKGDMAFTSYMNANGPFTNKISQQIDANDVEGLYMNTTGGIFTPGKAADFGKQQADYLTFMRDLEQAHTKSVIASSMKYRLLAANERDELARLQPMIGTNTDENSDLAKYCRFLQKDILDNTVKAEELFVKSQTPSATVIMQQEAQANQNWWGSLVAYDINKGSRQAVQ